MKAADARLHALGDKFVREIHGAGELIGLHAYQGDHAESAGVLHDAHEIIDAHAGIGLIESRYLDGDIIPQHATLHGVQDQAINGRHGVGRHGGPGPLDDITVIVVM